MEKHDPTSHYPRILILIRVELIDDRRDNGGRVGNQPAVSVFRFGASRRPWPPTRAHSSLPATWLLRAHERKPTNLARHHHPQPRRISRIGRGARIARAGRDLPHTHR